MDQSTFYYTTIDHSPVGRASYYFRYSADADSLCNRQNSRAEALHIKARYTVTEIDRLELTLMKVNMQKEVRPINPE